MREQATLPRQFDVELAWRAREGAVLTSGSRPKIVGGAWDDEIDEKTWSPEHLLLSSLNLCLMTTFQVIAGWERLRVYGYRSRAEAKVDRIQARLGARLGFTLLTLHVDLDVAPEDVTRTRSHMMEAKQYCLVAGALIPPIHLDLAVRAVEASRPVSAPQ